MKKQTLILFTLILTLIAFSNFAYSQQKSKDNGLSNEELYKKKKKEVTPTEDKTTPPTQTTDQKPTEQKPTDAPAKTTTDKTVVSKPICSLTQTATINCSQRSDYKVCTNTQTSNKTTRKVYTVDTGCDLSDTLTKAINDGTFNDDLSVVIDNKNCKNLIYRKGGNVYVSTRCPDKSIGISASGPVGYSINSNEAQSQGLKFQIKGDDKESELANSTFSSIKDSQGTSISASLVSDNEEGPGAYRQYMIVKNSDGSITSGYYKEADSEFIGMIAESEKLHCSTNE